MDPLETLASLAALTSLGQGKPWQPSPECGRRTTKRQNHEGKPQGRARKKLGYLSPGIWQAHHQEGEPRGRTKRENQENQSTALAQDPPHHRQEEKQRGRANWENQGETISNLSPESGAPPPSCCGCAWVRTSTSSRPSQRSPPATTTKGFDGTPRTASSDAPSKNAAHHHRHREHDSAHRESDR